MGTRKSIRRGPSGRVKRTEILYGGALLNDVAQMDAFIASIDGDDELRQAISSSRADRVEPLRTYNPESGAAYYGIANGEWVLCFTVTNLTPKQFEAIATECDAMSEWGADTFQALVERVLGREVSCQIWDPSAAALYGLRPPPSCADCQQQAHPYMVADELWLAAGMTQERGQYLCIPCIEKRLARALTVRDFRQDIEGVANTWIRWRAGRMVPLSALDAWASLRQNYDSYGQLDIFPYVVTLTFVDPQHPEGKQWTDTTEHKSSALAQAHVDLMVRKFARNKSRRIASSEIVPLWTHDGEGDHHG